MNIIAKLGEYVSIETYFNIASDISYLLIKFLEKKDTTVSLETHSSFQTTGYSFLFTFVLLIK